MVTFPRRSLVLLSSLPAERAAAAVAAQSDGQETAVEDEEVAMETDGKAEANDVAMETDEEVDDSDEEDDEAVAAAKPKKKKEARADPVASGLPKNKAELESLIRNIHKSVQTNILPRLHKCLTAKVHTVLIPMERHTHTSPWKHTHTPHPH